MELYQGRGKIVKQARPARGANPAAGDQHVIHADLGPRHQNGARHFAHAALGPIAHHGIAQLARGGKADAAGRIIPAMAGFERDMPMRGTNALPRLQKIYPLTQMEIARAHGSGGGVSA